MTEDDGIESYEARKAEHRARVTAHGSRAAAIYAADKLAKMPHLRADPDSASERQLAHYRQTVETLRAGHPELPFLGDLEQELEAVAAQRAATGSPIAARRRPPSSYREPPWRGRDRSRTWRRRTPTRRPRPRSSPFRAREVADHAHDVLDVADIERVHDMRVATRRLRAALEIFEPCFPPKELAAALAQVKAIADALGERRDRDVAIAALEEFAAGMPAPGPARGQTLIERLRVEQAEANEALAPFVDAGQLAALSELLSELVAAAEGARGAQA